MEAIIKHPEVKKCYDKLMDIINTPKIIDTSIKDKVWCEVLNQHGCIGKECPCFTTFENWFEHDRFPINSEIDFCNYRSKITLEIRINPEQCKYEKYKERLFISIYSNIIRYEFANGEKVVLKSLTQDLYGKHIFTVDWRANSFNIFEDSIQF